MNQLAQKQCVPCQGGVPPLPLDKRYELLGELNGGWEIVHHDSRLRRTFRFDDFAKPWSLAEKIAALAEEQWHHPVLTIGWGQLVVEIWTHKIDSLVESDYIFAAKVDHLYEKEFSK